MVFFNGYAMQLFSMKKCKLARACVRACVRASERLGGWMCACVRACGGVYVCVCVLKP